MNVGEVTSDLWASRPELRQRVGRMWTREHYMRHRLDRGNRFFKEKIKILQPVFVPVKKPDPDSVRRLQG